MEKSGGGTKKKEMSGVFEMGFVAIKEGHLIEKSIMLRLTGRYFHKHVRLAALTYLDTHGYSTERKETICRIMGCCPRTLDNWKSNRDAGKLEDGRLVHNVQP